MLKRMVVIGTAVCMLGTLTGCASIVSGTHQSVSVNTNQIKGATCSLENNKGKWYVTSTPASVVINRSYNDLKINCEKTGYKPSFKQVSSTTRPWVFGNILFGLVGGPIGAGVDIADGAAYNYPVDITVPMQK